MEKLEMGQVSLHCVFHGEDASKNFKELASEFYKDHVYRFVALTPDGEPKSDDVAFTAEFWRVPGWGIMVPPPCYKADGDGCAYQCADGDDEPIDQCKQCPLCCADKHRHQQGPPNAPLTLEDLWEMDGEPVWNDTMKKWVLVDLLNDIEPRTVDAQGRWRDLEDRYYRYKPEGSAP